MYKHRNTVINTVEKQSFALYLEDSSTIKKFRSRGQGYNRYNIYVQLQIEHSKFNMDLK